MPCTPLVLKIHYITFSDVTLGIITIDIFFHVCFRRRQQRLEEEHADLEYQIRCLMAQPETNRTDSDKQLEEQLISRLLEVWLHSTKNSIVEYIYLNINNNIMV